MTHAFQAGGPLAATSPCYVRRPDDMLAWEALQRMECITLIEPRQQGKTSLINQLRRLCETAGYLFVRVDLMPFREVKSEPAWYGRIQQKIAHELELTNGSSVLPIPKDGATWYEFLCSLAAGRLQTSVEDQGNFRTRLRQALNDHFSDEGLRDLCFDMGLDYDNLPAQGKASKAREIVAHVERTQEVDKLVEHCRRLCPTIPWESRPEAGEGAPPASDASTFRRSGAGTSNLAGRRLVIAFDEIGAVPKDWATGFFSAMRSVRQDCSEYLTFILAGATDPREMIADPAISPFNVATSIRLRDFSLAEVESLIHRLGAAEVSDGLAAYLHNLTGGQPYLCQQLCIYLSEADGSIDAPAMNAAVDRLFREDRNHIPGIRKLLGSRPTLLSYLCKVLIEKPRFSPAVNSYHFWLGYVVGIMAREQSHCQVRNPIYERVLKEAGFCSDPPAQENKRRGDAQRTSSPRSAPHPTARSGHPMRLRYLHISDLHLTRSTENKTAWNSEQFNQDFVTRSMLNAIDELVQRHGKTLDLVFITGDVARQGKDDEYAVAKVFCQRLLEVAGVTSDRLFLVPGNHDVDRSMVPKGHQSRLYHFEGQDQIIELLGDLDLFPLLMRKFAAFNRFAGEVLRREIFSDRQYSFTETTGVDRGGRKFHVKVAGLNSALFAGYDGDDQWKLAYGLPQVEAAVSKSHEEPHLTIALSHHPFTCFHPADRVCRNILIQHADLILTGHLHEPGNMFVRDAVGQAVLIGAGASFETRESQNSFNVVEVDLTTGAGEVQFFKYLPDHHLWKINTDANPSHERGIFQFTIERLARSPQ